MLPNLFQLGDFNTGVYCWRNIVNGKVYVGSAAVSFVSRKDSHWKCLQANTHPNRYLQAAWNKYGATSFAFEELEWCLPDECVSKEQYWIDTLKSAQREFGYNLSPTAGSQLGLKMSLQSCAKISNAKIGNKCRLGKPFSEEAKAKLSKARRRYKLSQSTKDKLAILSTGRIFSKEARAKISAALMGNKNHKNMNHSEETKAKMRAAWIIRKSRPGAGTHTMDARKKMSESAKARWAKKRQLLGEVL